MNNFTSSIHEVKISDQVKDTQDNFTAIYKVFSNSDKHLSDISNSCDIDKTNMKALQFILPLSILRMKLRLRIKPNNYIRDITDNDQLLINVCSPEKMLQTFLHVFEGLSTFTGNSYITNCAFLVSPPMVRNIQNVIFTQREKLHRFSFNLDKNEYAIGLYKLYIFLRIKIFEKLVVMTIFIRIFGNI